MKILLLENEVHNEVHNEPSISRLISMSGKSFDRASNVIELEEMLAVQNYELVILDLSTHSEKMQTIKTCVNHIDKSYIFISVMKRDLPEIEKLINLGADDFITRPFSSLEFNLRLNTIIRQQIVLGLNELNIGNIKYNISSGTILINNKHLDINRRELEILKILILNNKRLISIDEIYQKSFSIDDEVEQSSIRVYISRLRNKLLGTGVFIKSVRGLGYILNKE